jgi:hypothetical protein
LSNALPQWSPLHAPQGGSELIVQEATIMRNEARIEMIDHMHRVLIALLALIASAVAAGCGGGTGHQQTGVPTPPVAEQVRHALRDSLKSPTLPAMTDAQRPRLPFTAVADCSGPAGGGAGRYRCLTTPRKTHGIRSIIVQVRSDGQWSTQPLAVETTLHGRGTTAVTSVWGFGIRMPS